MDAGTFIKNTAETFRQLKVCVIIPTYNNATTIKEIVESVLDYTQQVIVVNDGSTDATPEILQKVHNICLVSYSPNRGKGMALRMGFKKAVELGYDHAITIDSDGQHFAKDLPLFLNKLEEEGPCLIMGSRDMKQDSIPGKSSFGYKFSNFWFKVETGIDCPDTQTGYRLYPLQPVSRMRFFTHKYEFEIEAIVRLAWAGIKVTSAPISVYYPPKGTRVTHFRPLKDFTRISILNTVLVAIAFLYIKPRDFVRWLFTKKDWKQEMRKILLTPGESDLTKANSMAFGGFMGIIPIWGLQLLVGVSLAHFMRLNKALVILAAHISIPPMVPFILFLSYKMGRPFMGSRAVNISFNKSFTLEKLGQNIEQYIYGSIFLAILTGISFWVVSFIFIKIFRANKSGFFKDIKRPHQL